MKNFSIIIPAFNEEASIGRLLDSIGKIVYPKSLYEVIVVNDGSTDATAQVVKQYSNVRLVNLPENVGRYECRKRGAESARYTGLLFIDAHSEVDPEILSHLDRLDAKVVNGRVAEAKPTSAFETFYQAIRRLIFPKFYQYPGPFYLTLQNFDSMPKGTGVLYVEKEILFSAYCDLAGVDMGKASSDDTKLLRTIVNKEPILNHPDVKIKYYSRSSFGASVKHLYERGPKFVDYYLNPAMRNFWLVIVFPLLGFILGICGLIFLPISAAFKITALVALNTIATLILARSVREFLTIFWIMPVCLMTFYAGILGGIGLRLLSRFKQ